MLFKNLRNFPVPPCVSNDTREILYLFTNFA